MPDIRRTGQLDDFDRPNEDPIVDPPWGRTSTARETMALVGGCAVHRPTHGFLGGESYYSLGSWSGDVEAWGHKTGGGGGAGGLFWSISLWETAGGASATGYRFRREESSGSAYSLYKGTLGSMSLLTSVAGPNYTHLLIRTQGGNVETWGSNNPGVTWSPIVSVADSTYRTNLKIGIGAGDNGNGQITEWTGVGGGPAIMIPRIMRYR